MATTVSEDSLQAQVYAAYSLAATSQLKVEFNLVTEQQQVEGFAPQRQQQFLAGRALLRWLCCQQLQVAPEQVEIVRQANGAPQLTVAGQHYSCSISHKDQAILVAIAAEGALGLDIEKIQLRKRQAQLIAQFADGFMHGIQPDDLAGFYQRWTLAEAVTKAEQGKLLATLHRQHSAYVAKSHHIVVADWLMCVYHSLGWPVTFDALANE